MILNDLELNKLSKTKGLVSPLILESIQPASIDIRLGKGFKKPSISGVIHTFDTEVLYDTFDTDKYILKPHEFILGTTMETLSLPDNITAFVEGRSSIGRMGLFIQNAGWIDPGFKGEITLEFYNASEVPILLCAGHRVGQLVFCKMSESCLKPYDGKYQNQKGTIGSRINLDTHTAYPLIIEQETKHNVPIEVGTIVQNKYSGEYGVIVKCNSDGTIDVVIGISDTGNSEKKCSLNIEQFIIKE